MRLQHYILTIFFAIFTFSAHAAPEQAGSLDDLVNKIRSEDSPKNQNKSRAANAAAGDLLMQAMSLLGVAYRFGGSTPSTGLDCSGFIQYIFKKTLKINMPRTAAQMAKTGQAVNKEELMPGDLVFFNTRGFAYSHVGLYMGNNKFIHSPRTGKSVEIVNMSSSYWTKRYNGARRVNRSTAGAGSSIIAIRETTEKRVTGTIAPQKNKQEQKESIKLDQQIVIVDNDPEAQPNKSSARKNVRTNPQPPEKTFNNKKQGKGVVQNKQTADKNRKNTKIQNTDGKKSNQKQEKNRNNATTDKKKSDKNSKNKSSTVKDPQKKQTVAEEKKNAPEKKIDKNKLSKQINGEKSTKSKKETSKSNTSKTIEKKKK